MSGLHTYFIDVYLQKRDPGTIYQDELDVEDIARCLANQCRYGGFVKRYYSVAEHCVLLSNAVSPDLRLAALLHDASEALLTDLPIGLKRNLPQFSEYEGRVLASICSKFGVGLDQLTQVSHYDRRIQVDELTHLSTDEYLKEVSDHECCSDREPIGVELYCWEPELAKSRFLERFYELTETTPPDGQLSLDFE